MKIVERDFPFFFFEDVIFVVTSFFIIFYYIHVNVFKGKFRFLYYTYVEGKYKEREISIKTILYEKKK